LSKDNLEPNGRRICTAFYDKKSDEISLEDRYLEMGQEAESCRPIVKKKRTAERRKGKRMKKKKTKKKSGNTGS